MENKETSIDVKDLTRGVEDAERLLEITTKLSDKFAGLTDAASIIASEMNKSVITVSQWNDLTKSVVRDLTHQLLILKSAATVDISRVTAIERQLEIARDQLEKSEAAMIIDKERLLQQEKMNGYANKLKGSAGEIGTMIGGIKDTMTQIVKDPMFALISLLGLALEQFISMDKAAEEFRKTTGLTIDQTRGIRKEAEKITTAYSNLGVSIESANKAGAALVSTFGDNAKFSEQNMKFVALMSANLGVAEEDSAKVLQNFMGMSGSSSETAQQISLYASELSKAGGVSFPKVMKDVANTSSKTLSLLKGNPIALVKASVEARRLGMSLEQVASAADSLLDFENSINREMELSVLLGKNVNLMEMRRLSFTGDLAGLAREQNKFLQEQGDLSKLNKFQINAMAEAMGLTVEAMIKMKSQQQLVSQLSVEDRKAYEDKLKLVNKVEDITKLGPAEAKKRLDALEKEQKMQGEVNKLMNVFKSLVIDLGNILLPIIDLLQPIIGILSVVAGWIGKGTAAWKEWDHSIIKVIISLGVITTLLKTNILGSLLSIPGKALTGIISKMSQWLGITRSIATTSASLSSSGSGTGIKDWLTNVGKGLHNFFKAIKPDDILKMAAVMGVLVISLIAMSFAFKQFADVKWEDMAKASVAIIGLGLALLAFGAIMTSSVAVTGPAILILLGFAAAIGILALAAMGFAKASQMMIPFFEFILNQTDYTKFFKAAAGIYVLGSAFSALGALSPLIALGSLSMAGMAVSLLLLSIPLRIVSTSLESIMMNGEGAISIFDKLANSVGNFASALDKVSVVKMAALSGMMTVGAISSLAQGVGQAIGGTTSAEEVVDNKTTSPISNIEIVKAIQDLRDDLKNGGIAVYLDGKKVSSELALAVNDV